MRIYFRWRVSVICVLLAAGMTRASFWQWDRHLEKKVFIGELEQRLNKPPVEISELSATTPDQLEYRRVWVSGTFDFDHEIILRNRRHNDVPGVYVLTPLVLPHDPKRILISRGFLPLPLSTRDTRIAYQTPREGRFLVVLKKSLPRRVFAPKDPPAGVDLPWVDAWLRVDLDSIAAQLPYPLLPMYGEIMPVADANAARQEIVSSKESSREEMLFLASRSMHNRQTAPSMAPLPIPVFDAVVPPGRHLGYVYEWGIMAVMTILIGLVLQLRPVRTDPLGNKLCQDRAT